MSADHEFATVCTGFNTKEPKPKEASQNAKSAHGNKTPKKLPWEIYLLIRIVSYKNLTIQAFKNHKTGCVGSQLQNAKKAPLGAYFGFCIDCNRS